MMIDVLQPLQVWVGDDEYEKYGISKIVDYSFTAEIILCYSTL